MRLRILFVFLALTITRSAIAQKHEVNCSAAVENREAQTINLGPFHFTWSSYWSKLQVQPEREGSHYCICREVYNDAKEPLFYSWPVAGDIQNKGLAPKTTDTVCSVADDYAKPPEKGLLYYGRRGFQTETRVWKSISEVESSHRPKIEARNRHIGHARDREYEDAYEDQSEYTEANIPQVWVTADLHSSLYRPRQYIFFLPMPRKKEIVDARLTLISKVEQTANGYLIENTVFNLNPNTSVNVEIVSHSRVPIKAGRNRVSYFRRHVWLMHEDPPAENFHQEIVAQEEVTTISPPILRSELVRINTPRGAPAINLYVPVWLRDTK